MNENYNMDIDERIYKVCENAENEYSQSQRNNFQNNQIINNEISSKNTNNKISNILQIHNYLIIILIKEINFILIIKALVIVNIMNLAMNQMEKRVKNIMKRLVVVLIIMN